MPIDLFIGKSNVQTYVYVFRVNEPHQADDTVKFIDFLMTDTLGQTVKGQRQPERYGPC